MGCGQSTAAQVVQPTRIKSAQPVGLQTQRFTIHEEPEFTSNTNNNTTEDSFNEDYLESESDINSLAPITGENENKEESSDNIKSEQEQQHNTDNNVVENLKLDELNEQETSQSASTETKRSASRISNKPNNAFIVQSERAPPSRTSLRSVKNTEEPPQQSERVASRTSVKNEQPAQETLRSTSRTSVRSVEKDNSRANSKLNLKQHYELFGEEPLPQESIRNTSRATSLQNDEPLQNYESNDADNHIENSTKENFDLFGEYELTQETVKNTSRATSARSTKQDNSKGSRANSKLSLKKENLELFGEEELPQDSIRNTSRTSIRSNTDKENYEEPPKIVERNPSRFSTRSTANKENQDEQHPPKANERTTTSRTSVRQDYEENTQQKSEQQTTQRSTSRLSVDQTHAVLNEMITEIIQNSFANYDSAIALANNNSDDTTIPNVDDTQIDNNETVFQPQINKDLLDTDESQLIQQNDENDYETIRTSTNIAHLVYSNLDASQYADNSKLDDLNTHRTQNNEGVRIIEEKTPNQTQQNESIQQSTTEETFNVENDDL